MENHKKVIQLLNHQFDGVYTTVDNFLFVNLDYLTNRRYQFEGVNEFLYTISTVGKNNNIVFLIRDGANPYLTSMKLLIEKTIEIHNLDSESCFIVGYYKLGINGTTTIFQEQADVWAHQIDEFLREFPLANNSFCLKFAGLFGRYDPFRLKICRYLFENFKNESLLSFNSHNINYNPRWIEHFKDDKEWANTYCPIKLDFDPSGWVPFQHSLINISNHYQKYFLEIVAETDPHTDNFFTEKTLKNFYLGKPFLLLSGKGSLKYLRSLGYKTFSPIIDESYDEFPGIADRIDAICKEIDRIGKFNLEQLGKMHNDLIPIFEHNRQQITLKKLRALEQKIIKIV